MATTNSWFAIMAQKCAKIISNAMKYSGASRDITLRVECEDQFAAISVVDYGIGIAPEAQAHIFERFYHATTPERNLVPLALSTS